jgi:hypothetical protein
MDRPHGCLFGKANDKAAHGKKIDHRAQKPPSRINQRSCIVFPQDKQKANDRAGGKIKDISRAPRLGV